MVDRRKRSIDCGFWEPVDRAIDGMGRNAFKSTESMAKSGFVHQIHTSVHREGGGDDSRYPVTLWSVLMHMIEHDLVTGNIAKASCQDGIHVGFTQEIDQITYALLAQTPSIERDEWDD